MNSSSPPASSPVLPFPLSQPMLPPSISTRTQTSHLNPIHTPRACLPRPPARLPSVYSNPCGALCVFFRVSFFVHFSSHIYICKFPLHSKSFRSVLSFQFFPTREREFFYSQTRLEDRAGEERKGSSLCVAVLVPDREEAGGWPLASSPSLTHFECSASRASLSSSQLGTSRFRLPLLGDRLLLALLGVGEFDLGRWDEGGMRVRSGLEAERAHFGIGPGLSEQQPKKREGASVKWMTGSRCVESRSRETPPEKSSSSRKKKKRERGWFLKGLTVSSPLFPYAI